jgi:hypothetical protein
VRNKYQRKDRKSNHKFEVVGGQELMVRVPLPVICWGIAFLGATIYVAFLVETMKASPLHTESGHVTPRCSRPPLPAHKCCRRLW